MNLSLIHISILNVAASVVLTCGDCPIVQLESQAPIRFVAQDQEPRNDCGSSEIGSEQVNKGQSEIDAELCQHRRT